MMKGINGKINDGKVKQKKNKEPSLGALGLILASISTALLFFFIFRERFKQPEITEAIKAGETLCFYVCTLICVILTICNVFSVILGILGRMFKSGPVTGLWAILIGTPILALVIFWIILLFT